MEAILILYLTCGLVYLWREREVHELFYFDRYYSIFKQIGSKLILFPICVVLWVFILIEHKWQKDVK